MVPDPDENPGAQGDGQTCRRSHGKSGQSEELDPGLSNCCACGLQGPHCREEWATCHWGEPGSIQQAEDVGAYGEWRQNLGWCSCARPPLHPVPPTCWWESRSCWLLGCSTVPQAIPFKTQILICDRVQKDVYIYSIIWTTLSGCEHSKCTGDLNLKERGKQRVRRAGVWCPWQGSLRSKLRKMSPGMPKKRGGLWGLWSNPSASPFSKVSLEMTHEGHIPE